MSSRANFGQVQIFHKGKRMFTSVGSSKYESVYGGSIDGLPVTGIIPLGYDHRPDLIADLFLDTPSAWWIICETNAIFDVFEQLKPGKGIRLPS